MDDGELTMLGPTQRSVIPMPNQVQQGRQTNADTTGRSISDATSPTSSSMIPNASIATTAARASMLSLPSGSNKLGIEDSHLNSATGDISITYNVNCTTYMPAGNGGPPGEDQRQRAKAEIKNVNDEGVQIVKNSAKESEAKKTELTGGNINEAICSPKPEACAIYVRNLLHKGYGWPFYIPGPSKHLPIAYRREGMQIGDVGIINVRGSFEFLFNILHPANHPINAQGVPKKFRRLRIQETDIQEHSEFIGKDHISNGSSVTKTSNNSGFSFESSALEGAILALPVGATSKDLVTEVIFKKYLTIHAEDWYRYLISRGRNVKNGEVCLIKGYHKTSRWGIATFADSTANEQPLLLEFNHVIETNTGMVYEWKHSGTAQVRTGPGAQEDLDPDREEKFYENQSVFGRMMCATVQEDVWNELAAEFDNVELDYATDDDSMDDVPPESSNQGSTGSRRANSSTTRSTSTSANAPGQRTLAMADNISMHPEIQLISDFRQETASPFHPSKAINMMLLKLHPSARLAITSDDDWISILRKDDLEFPSIEELCARIKASLVIRQGKDVVFLEARNPRKTTSDPRQTGRHTVVKVPCDQGSPSKPTSLVVQETALNSPPSSFAPNYSRMSELFHETPFGFGTNFSGSNMITAGGMLRKTTATTMITENMNNASFTSVQSILELQKAPNVDVMHETVTSKSIEPPTKTTEKATLNTTDTVTTAADITIDQQETNPLDIPPRH